MSQYRVLIKRITSLDGRLIAEAKSVALASSEKSTISQVVTVKISKNSSCSSSSASSYTSSH